MTAQQKLDMLDSARQIENTDCFEDGVQTPLSPGEDQTSLPPTTLVLRCEDDDEHYAKRELGPGIMHRTSNSSFRRAAVRLARCLSSSRSRATAEHRFRYRWRSG